MASARMQAQRQEYQPIPRPKASHGKATGVDEVYSDNDENSYESFPERYGLDSGRAVSYHRDDVNEDIRTDDRDG